MQALICSSACWAVGAEGVRSIHPCCINRLHIVQLLSRGRSNVRVPELGTALSRCFWRKHVTNGRGPRGEYNKG